MQSEMKLIILFLFYTWMKFPFGWTILLCKVGKYGKKKKLFIKYEHWNWMWNHELAMSSKTKLYHFIIFWTYFEW